MAVIMNADAMARTLMRMAHQIAERNPGLNDLVMVGIRRRGVPLAERMARNLERIDGVRPPVIAIDIEPYRDDRAHPRPRARFGDVFNWSDQVVILVDDVLFTGRTVRAALDAVVDQGRPRMVQLAVLIDRGHRELPIRPDYVGKNIPTHRSEIVEVRLAEIDGMDEVSIAKEGQRD